MDRRDLLAYQVTREAVFQLPTVAPPGQWILVAPRDPQRIILILCCTDLNSNNTYSTNRAQTGGQGLLLGGLAVGPQFKQFTIQDEGALAQAEWYLWDDGATVTSAWILMTSQDNDPGCPQKGKGNERQLPSGLWLPASAEPLRGGGDYIDPVGFGEQRESVPYPQPDLAEPLLDFLRPGRDPRRRPYPLPWDTAARD